VFAAEVFACDSVIEDVFKASVLFWPGGESVAGRAAWAVLFRVLHLVAGFTTRCQSSEFCGSERAGRRLRFVALNAIDGRVLGQQRVFGVAAMVELEPGDWPAHWRLVAFGARPFKLALVWIFMTIRALRFQAAEPGKTEVFPRPCGGVTFSAIDGRVLGEQRVFGVAAMVELEPGD
jgi:hypothetical protein